MDYRNILKNELRRSATSEEDVYCFHQPVTAGKISDVDYLTKHIPSQSDIVEALNKLLIDNPDNSVMLVPVRPFLQTFLKITSQRLDDLIAENDWLDTWIEHIRTSQEVKIAEMFSSGNLEDSKLKWMIWTILGESVDLTTTRMTASTDASSILMSHGNDE